MREHLKVTGQVAYILLAPGWGSAFPPTLPWPELQERRGIKASIYKPLGKGFSREQ